MNAFILKIENVVIQGLIGVATVAAVVVALWQMKNDKRVRENDEMRSQAGKISSRFECLEDCHNHPDNFRRGNGRWLLERIYNLRCAIRL